MFLPPFYFLLQLPIQTLFLLNNPFLPSHNHICKFLGIINIGFRSIKYLSIIIILMWFLYVLLIFMRMSIDCMKIELNWFGWLELVFSAFNLVLQLLLLCFEIWDLFYWDFIGLWGVLVLASAVFGKGYGNLRQLLPRFVIFEFSLTHYFISSFCLLILYFVQTRRQHYLRHWF